MDRNFLLALALSMLVFTFWASTQQPRVRPAQQPAEAVDEAVVPESGLPAPSVPSAAAPAVPDADTSGDAAAYAEKAPQEAAPGAAPPRQAPEWSRVFETDLYRATVTNRGAALVGFELKSYEEWGPEGKKPIDMLNPEQDRLLVGSMPFEELGLGDLRTASFEVEEERPHGVTFVLSGNGLRLRKRYDFDPSSYEFRLAIELANDSGEVVQPRFAIDWPARVREGSEFKSLSFVVRHTGTVERQPVASVGSKGFLGFGGSSDETIGTEEGVKWFGVDTRYFVAALAPERSADARAILRPIETGKIARNVLFFDGIALPSGNEITQELRGYVGPKLDDTLASFGYELDSAVDRGWSWLEPLTRFFSWLLRALYGVIPNYGVAIIVLTVLVRAVTTPIMSRQMKSMEKMRLVQPKIKDMQAKYADDRERQSQEMMKLYKEHGVNPLGGCLPMLLQLPVFIGLFYALQSSIDLRHAPFVLWMHDLSAPETLFMIPGLDLPFRVLPILMAASMVLQAKLQPMSPDPSQAQMMTTVMPLMMLVLFYQFPSGLVLYYMLSNLLGIAHQRWVGRNMKKD